MESVSEPLAPPRLVLRVGALGDRRFGPESGVDDPPAALERAARVACAEVVRVIGAAVVEVFSEDLAQVFPPLDHPWRAWWESRWGWLLGRADVWGRRANAGKPAAAFRDESPLVSVLTAREPGGGAFVAEAALAMNPVPAPPAGSAERYVQFESVAVVVEDPDAPASSRPVEDPRTLSVGHIPAQPRDADAAGARSRADAHTRAEVARRRAFGFRARAEALRHHADLLVAVWDPDADTNARGTTESVAAALAQQVPVVAIRVTGPGPATIHLLRTTADLRRPPVNAWQDVLGSCVKQILAFPDAPADAAAPGVLGRGTGPRAVFRTFLERVPTVAPWPARAWPPFRAWLDGRGTFASAAAGVLGLAAPSDAPANGATAPGYGTAPTRAAVSLDAARRRAAAASDALGNAHRGGLVTAYLLGALTIVLAVLLDLLPYSTGWIWIVGVLGLVLLAALLVLFALWRASTLEGWSAAHAETRLLAEALGAMEHLAPLGVRVPLPRPSAAGASDPAAGDPSRFWSLWYFRALVREAPLRLPVIPRVPLAQQRDRLVADWIGDAAKGPPEAASRAAHHLRAAAGYRRLARGVERATAALFLVVLAAALLHLLVLPVDGLHWFGWICVVLCLGGPAVLAAMWGFRAQTEAVRMQQRSESVALTLLDRAARLRALDLADRETADSRWPLAAEAAATAGILVEEAAGWAPVHRSAGIWAG